MALPKLTDAQIDVIIQQVAKYIESQRETYRKKATPLNTNQKEVMAPFFPQSVLDSARVIVLNDERVSNPPFYGELVQIGFPPDSLPDFAEMRAITFVDMIVSQGPITTQTFFHELVHEVQYENLGVPDFAAKYVKGFLTGGSYARPCARWICSSNPPDGLRKADAACHR